MSFDLFENLRSWGPAVLLALVSGGAILWGLYGDRARGRRRCPKCWYDMTGAVRPTCPECGFTARRESQFHHDRRRWRMVVLGLLLLAPLWHTALATSFGPRWWMTVLPTEWLIAAMPLVDAPDPVIYRELQDRMIRGDLDEEEWNSLFDRVLAGDGSANPGSLEWEIKYGAILLMQSERFMRNSDRALRRLQLPPRIEVMRTSPLAPGLPMGVDLQLRHWWPRGTDARLTITASAGGVLLLDRPVTVHHRDVATGARPFPLTIQAAPSSADDALGIRAGPGVPDDAASIDVEVVVERFDEESGVWQSFPPQQVGAIIDRIESVEKRLTPFPDPDADAVFGEIFTGRIVRLGPGLRRVQTFLAPRDLFTRTFDDLALGLTIELLRDGQVVHSVQVWGEVGTNRDTERFQHLHSSDGSSFADAIGTDGAAWTLRIRGDRGLALRVPGAQYYWEGEITREVIVEDRDRPGWIEEWTLEEP